jgi:hypothetical protein
MDFRGRKGCTQLTLAIAKPAVTKFSQNWTQVVWQKTSSIVPTVAKMSYN